MAERDSQDPQDSQDPRDSRDPRDSPLERGWLLSPPGRPYLESLLQRNRRRVFGLLERPALPPPLAVPTLPYKLFLVGRSGVGKTALVAALAGTPRTPRAPGTAATPAHHETLGTAREPLGWRGNPTGGLGSHRGFRDPGRGVFMDP
ncbi:ciliogenesis and planar polarity effector 2-like [Corapipo altera]|uniref:ciliogenesis and planar polarity effector 2-like n=1 Tax=Corapipo altera TaxID=415028 RepID=UPI000FD64A50|nr:ciliogenesis and planar polarity effector 2-like [Corapipo altera]